LHQLFWNSANIRRKVLGEGSMSASNRAIVQRLFNEGLNNRDFSVIAELFGDCIYHLPLIGELRGEALKQFFAYIFDAFPDAQRTVEEQVTDDNQTVVTRWRATGTHQGEFMGIAPTGKRITITGISIHRIASGKIVEEWQEWDSLGLMQQLGVVPSFKFEAKAA
jgi:steroid delta-isomerase-like uncharacterized protein